ncbi:hypothetical protein SNE40_013135 [Patella caerulea]|uniref:Gag protein n=1 Tax=Patella caerulea TaxID=87958 RepID=A0AAN8JHJ4_PATCE
MADGKQQLQNDNNHTETDREQGNSSHNETQNRIDSLKQTKVKVKTAFTKVRNNLLWLIEVAQDSDENENTPSKRDIRQESFILNSALDEAVEIMGLLADEYAKKNDTDNMKKISREMEELEEKFSAAHEEVKDYLISCKDTMSTSGKSRSKEDVDRFVQSTIDQSPDPIHPDNENTHSPPESNGAPPLQQPVALSSSLNQFTKPIHPENNDVLPLQQPLALLSPNQSTEKQSSIAMCQIVPTDDAGPPVSMSLGHDMWKQLKRVSIPMFSGDKKTYESWKAAFHACVDSAPATSEYKLLQLRQYLSGEALKCVDNLGHSATSYAAAKQRLDRKYGGKRRQINIFLEEIDSFKPIRQGVAKDLDLFADILDIAVVKIKDMGRAEELGNGSLYTKLQTKMPESLLAQYQRWVFENGKIENVETLHRFIIQEAEFQTVASETIRGVIGASENKYKGNNSSHRTHATYSDQSLTRREYPDLSISNQRQVKCVICLKPHVVYRCDQFKSMNNDQRWMAAKEHRLCFRCLGRNHDP